MLTLDLNADLGEGFGRWTLGDDDALLDVVTSANVACGFHAGDPSTMRRVCDHAVARGVSIGAQVGYHDLAGFGRRFVDVDPYELTQDVIYQIGALDAFARVAGTRVRYVKPHGALYSAVGHHMDQAAAVVEAVLEYDPTLPVLGLPGSLWLRLAERSGLTVVHEAFADRAYQADGALVPRSEPGAVLHDPDQIVRRCVALARGDAITDIEGQDLLLAPASICVHGDTPGAADLARRARAALLEAGITLAPFA
jgi:5-oxoprolinase (ATP-hydrolysing) subunit A